MPARKKKALCGAFRPPRSGPNIPDAQRGERGELPTSACHARYRSATRKASARAKRHKGAIVEMALITLQHVPEE